jgi:signal transduction histidine kinase
MKKLVKGIKDFAYRYRAIFFIVGLASASIAGVIHLFTVSNNHNVELVTRSCLNTAQKAFTDLETNSSSMLSATLEALLTNKEIGAQFVKRNRENLYQLTRPLFEHLKKQNHVTHWYFLNPEPGKTCFLRVHAPHKYNDIITRVTMDTSIKTKKIAFGKELGKTALALRAVHPYYYENQLIGYIELGIEMEDLFKVLSQQTGNEYGLLIKKEFLDESKWASVNAEKKIPNNWNDMEHLLLVNKTSDAIRPELFKEKFGNPGNIPDEGIVLEKITKDKKHFARGIFPFFDAAGRKVGGVFIRKDITPIYNAMQGQKQKIVLLILFFMGIITFFMVFFHKRAERELRTYRTRLEEMVKESPAELLEINKRLNLEIEEHKRVQEALQDECTAREEAEEKQVEAVKHAERSARMASIGVMAAGVTHEINQPLNAIKVTADSIQYWHRRNPGVLPQDFVDQLGIITKSVKRIVEIIQHMRAFWVVPHAPGVSDVNINKAVRNAFSLTRQQILAHGINHRFLLDTASPAPVFKGNLIHIEQIIVNLLVNAIRALDEKDASNKEITVTTQRQDQWVVLEIEDNGPGLPEVDVNKLFDPFFSTDTSGEGMGLGLAIVKRYIDKYNGTIKVRNQPEGGAVFTIKFPIADKR